MSPLVYGQIDRKAEDAFAGFIDVRRGTLLADIQIVKGFDVLEKATERIEIVCARCRMDLADEVDFNIGNYFCDIDIAYVRHYKSARTASEQKKGKLFDLLLRDDIVEQLNNAGVRNFHALGGVIGEGPSWQVNQIENQILVGDEVQSTLSGTLYCQPSTP